MTDALATLTLNDLVRRLYDIGAINTDLVKGYTLKRHEKNPDAPPSPWYINLRIADNKNGTLTLADVAAISGFIYRRLRDDGIEFDGLCGIPQAGEPFAKELQQLIYMHESRAVPRITLAKETAGARRRVGEVLKVQDLPRGSKVLLVDDLITEATSAIEAEVQLRNAGFVVTDCAVFLDRTEGGEEELMMRGVRLHAPLNAYELLAILRDNKFVGELTAAHIRTYLDNI